MKAIEKIITEITERIVIEYANLSGRESANRAEFRKRIHEIITSALAQQFDEIKRKIESIVNSELIYVGKKFASSGEMDARNVMLKRLKANNFTLIDLMK